MTHPTPDDVHSAVHWALSHDLAALLAYRQVGHLDRSARWQADAALVARWQDATRTGLRDAGPRGLVAELPRAHC
ncbi:hypothetical protein BCE75_10221 [Isoptericola sp. CG 20/1183]|uniref:Uncharacterized protein n=1 Tax=Isoptericola halotolerans TaxID=300560 RepID=A0ABX5EI78_9MICO|nr:MULTISPECIES: hypothetical protein [Isoptericola]MCK0118201.1 hypothetical protein [Isoptericola sp. S6320L]PRZ09314.1 hypothetical protein BCE75_10221 [Isoptericola sp. CG 20/1183]PRZ10115.1 hypothetical protein BCL65_101253 [Isoptericola halotolerans]